MNEAVDRSTLGVFRQGDELDGGLSAMRTDFSLDDIAWPGGRIVFQWWCEARRGTSLPTRADFSPTILGRHLSGICLVTVPEAGGALRFRLAGTGITRALGWDPTGRALVDLPAAEPLLDRCSWAVEHRAPYLCCDQPLSVLGKGYLVHSSVVVPLADESGRVAILIAHVHLASSFSR
ncbi:PAS domain-containing protein [Rhodothalassium salexigens]|uniref:PAS domain-containing protein n=1 Tax=Rhodothalassium salexigens TaxID=1086 RepID=UPI0019145741